MTIDTCQVNPAGPYANPVVGGNTYLKRLSHLPPRCSVVLPWSKSQKQDDVFSFCGILSSYGDHLLWVEHALPQPHEKKDMLKS